MHRSASWMRFSSSDEYYMHSSSPVSVKTSSSSMEVQNELPMYDPDVEMAQKEKSRTKFAENAVHVIPFVLLLCAFILWLYSNPDVGVGINEIRPDSAAARSVEGLTIEGNIDTDSDGTQTGFLPIDVEDVGGAKQSRREYRKASRILMNQRIRIKDYPH
ncbi:hypothetical protein HS088_TW19G00639 [Tripterygium wilfordii]|uniref:Transmembrane protein n=1 Tax=Tripterygium wilfordii TaxID=458696 RepID=A0A7J7CBD2_TRIWF|nr:uncharacterized protein LOC119984947 [Tripterygium wilfordii]KAF5731036.1 hypothetical protein HS088_TW19G00639 [Tripterygium wilfordii]